MNDKEKLLELLNSINDTNINDILPKIYQHFNLDDNSNDFQLNEQAQRYMLDESLLNVFFSKLMDFYKYAPKDVLTNFQNDFIPKFQGILKDYNENKMFELLSDWFDTIDVYSNPDTVDMLEQSYKDIKEGNVEIWNPKTFLE